MTLETFFEQFELLADAPNGVKKLRELILQIAVQGKLVPQDSQDEPALALLERIKLNKEQLVKAKQISKDEALALIESKDVPFLLPKNWEWAYLGQISNTIHYGYTASGNHETSEVRLLRITDIQDNQVDWSMVPGCEIEPNKLKNYELKNGDILIARTGGTIGKSYLVKDISVCAVFASYLIRVVPNSLFTPRYLKLFLESPFYWKQLYSKSMGTGQPNVNATSLKSLYIPIPPLNEQQRIVEQVEHLMKMCDRLEEQQKKRRESCIRLNEGAIAQLLSASNAEESDRHWQRISNNFDLFYSLPENINKLRQAILTLAVQGKLVSQDPNVEAASALVERIKNKKSQKRSISELKHLPYEIPETWCWVNLGDVAEHCLGKMLDKQKNKGKPLPYLRNINVRWLNFDLDSLLEMPFEEKELERFSVKAGDVLICEGGEAGRAAIWKDQIPEIKFQKALHRVRVSEALNNYYLVYCLLADSISGNLEGYFTGATFKHFTGQELNRYLLPLPPIEEQKRIVAKVDHLMKLCDELEANLKGLQAYQEKLMETAVAQLMQAISKVPALC